MPLSSLPSSLSFLLSSFFSLTYLHLPTVSSTSLSSFLTSSCLPAYYLFISKSLPYSSLPFSHLHPYFHFPTMPYIYTSLHSPSPSSSLPAFTFSSLISFSSSFLPFAPPSLHLPIMSYTSLHSSSTAPSLPPSLYPHRHPSGHLPFLLSFPCLLLSHSITALFVDKSVMVASFARSCLRECFEVLRSSLRAAKDRRVVLSGSKG